MLQYYMNLRVAGSRQFERTRGDIISDIFRCRTLCDVQRVDYDINTIYTMDMDPSGYYNYGNDSLLTGLSDGLIAFLQVDHLGKLYHEHCFYFSRNRGSHRVQWSPKGDLYSNLDNHTLYLADAAESRALEKHCFTFKTTWSDWNANDVNIIAVCGSESQTRLIDLRSGSSAHTITLGAQSGHSSHRATRCIWSKLDTNCLIVGDNEGYLHVYDTRQTYRPKLLSTGNYGQISGMSFTNDQCSLITSHGTENQLIQWTFDKCTLKAWPSKFRKHEKPEKQDNSGIKRKKSRKIIPLPVDAYLRCQFHVTDRHVFCPVPARVRKSKELYIYDLDSGYRIKTIQSDDILSQGVYSVVSLLPEQLVLYVGGRGRLRTWALDELHRNRLDDLKIRFHQSRWDESDGEA